MPGFDGTKAKFPAWKQTSLCQAKLHGLFEIFTAGVDFSVADEGMPIPTLQQNFPGENIKKHFIALNILDVLEGSSDRDTLMHVSSPTAGRHAVDTHGVYAWRQCSVSPVSNFVASKTSSKPYPRLRYYD